MRMIWVVLWAAVVAYFLLGAYTRMAPVPAHHLAPLNGVLESMEELAGRRGLTNGHVVLVIESGGVRREVVSYDRELLDDLRVGALVEVGVNRAVGGIEVWTVRSEQRIVRTYEDTLAFRKGELGRQQRNIVLFSVLGVLALVVRSFLMKNADASS